MLDATLKTRASSPPRRPAKPGRGEPAKHSPRGEAARARLKEATGRVLERVGYRQMRVADVTREAGVATGLFHHYFPDLKTATIEVLRDFMTRFEDLESIERGVVKGGLVRAQPRAQPLGGAELCAQPGHHALHGAGR